MTVNKSGTNAPYLAQESAYKDAMWGGFAFGIIGALLAATFLRHVGIVGHKEGPKGSNDEEKATVSTNPTMGDAASEVMTAEPGEEEKPREKR